MAGDLETLIAEGREALRRGDGAAARVALEAAAAYEESGDVLAGLGHAAYLEFRFADAVREYERAYAAYREATDSVGAIHAARQVSYIYGAVLGDGAVMNGWNARAESLAANADSVERGWVALNKAIFHAHRPTRDALLGEALDIARRFGDLDLELVGLAYLGASLVHGDRAAEGMKLLDEALAGVAGGDVKDFQHLEEIFCQLFSACETARDVARADQWIRIGDAIAESRNLPSVSAFCRTHYGGLLTSAGRWAEADEALTEATRIWGMGFGPLRGGALLRLADLRVRQGRYEEAEQLLDGFDVNADTAAPFASLHLARGEPVLAADVIDRALAQTDRSSAAAARLFALAVDVDIARGALAGAAAAAETLERIAVAHGTDYLRATAALARGRLCVATGAGDAASCLRDAVAAFAKARVPLELASARLELARASKDERPEVAIAEAKSALDAFETLEAARLADAAGALLRELGAPVRTGPKGVGALTKREGEVLELLGHGLSNPEISDRLYISRKTVEHHVGNVLQKLGLRSRAEAAAYAARAEEKSSS